MNKKDIYKEIGIPKTFFLLTTSMFFFLPILNDGWINISPFYVVYETLINFKYFDSILVVASFIIFIPFLISIYFYIKMVTSLFKYEGFPSIIAAKKYFIDYKKLKEQKKSNEMKRNYELKMKRLEEEKKKFL